MTKGSNNMENKSDEKFIVIQAAIESNNQDMKSNEQDSDEKMKKFIEYFKEMLVAITHQINTLKYPPTQKNSPKLLDPTNVFPTNRRDTPLEGGQSTKIGGMWTLKHDIRSPKLYKIPIKT